MILSIARVVGESTALCWVHRQRGGAVKSTQIEDLKVYIDGKITEVMDKIQRKADREDVLGKADKDDMKELRTLVLGGLATGLVTLLTLLVTVLLVVMTANNPTVREHVTSALCALQAFGR